MLAHLAQGEWHYDAWWWISFASADLPEGQQLQGVAVVQAGSLPKALTTCWNLGINPGGEALSLQIPSQHVPAREFRNRLLTREEVQAAGL